MNPLSLVSALFGKERPKAVPAAEQIRRRWTELSALSDRDLKTTGRRAADLIEVTAVTAAAASRVLGLEMFDAQLRGALVLAQGRIAEMQTGEGKTLAAVPAAAWFAKSGHGVHVMTVNDYLARRDARWMGAVYEWLGLTVGCVQQGMEFPERRAAYACDLTYVTANEAGFDFLRDRIALDIRNQVHRPFAVAVIDEVDSILIDEARTPLVIAGVAQGAAEQAAALAHAADRVTRGFRRGTHYTVEEHERNIALTDAGVQAIEGAFRCGNLFAEANLDLFTAVHDSLHAHALLRRDVDYVLKDGVVESVDEFKGRIAQDRRWPAGLHAAVEAKEGVALKAQGRILGSITLQNLIALYPRVCGMTGTAATQAREFREIYGLEVETIPPNRPVIRVDLPDALFATKAEKERAVLAEIATAHAAGRPVLVGTSSVADSEQLSAALGSTRHHVLNARNEEEEAAIVAKAGEPGAVTISTNMAGRGTDIRLGRGVAELGGLYVIGTNRHESRRIDNQLRGRAGRQGDPGRSRFFVSREDDLLVKFGIDDPRLGYDPDGIQRVVEGQNLEIRLLLMRYEDVIEAQRQIIQTRRQGLLDGSAPCASDPERVAAVSTIDDLWSDFLAAVTEYRRGIHWISWSGGDPLHEYLVTVDRIFQELCGRIDDEIPRRQAAARDGASATVERGATWTYLVTDQPFGDMTERFARGFTRMLGLRKTQRAGS
jgi:preprotein translocase subunit SecA